MKYPLIIVALLAVSIPAQVGDATLTELRAEAEALKLAVEKAEAVAAMKAQVAALKAALAVAKSGKPAAKPVAKPKPKPAAKAKPAPSIQVIGWPLLRSREMTVIKASTGSRWWYCEIRKAGGMTLHTFESQSAATDWAKSITKSMGFRLVDAATLANRERASGRKFGSR